MVAIVHKQAMDVFFEILSFPFIDRKRRKIKGRWWNYGFDGSNPWCIDPDPITITITPKAWNDDWRYFNPSTDKHPGRR